jgi:8-O-methyltransferase
MSAVTTGPEAVLQVAAGARKAKVLFVAVELGIFAELAGEPLGAEELGTRLGLHPLGCRDMLLALLAMGLLERDAAGYRNAPVADAYLVRGRPGFLGGFLRFLDRVLHEAWQGLEHSVRTGEPHNSAAGDGDPYEPMYGDGSDRTGFLDAMDVLSAPIGAQLSQLDWSRRRSFVDVGGARGSLAAQIVKANSHLGATVFDLPELEPAATEHLTELGLRDAVTFQPGDFFTDPLPSADVVIFGHVLHNWPESRRRELLRKAFAALPPGGAVLVYDPMIDPRRPQLANVLASLNMLVWSAGGAEYPVGDARGWMLDAGFGAVTAQRLGPTSTLLVGHRDG